jgi:hypothetical protein
MSRLEKRKKKEDSNVTASFPMCFFFRLCVLHPPTHSTFPFHVSVLEVSYSRHPLCRCESHSLSIHHVFVSFEKIAASADKKNRCVFYDALNCREWQDSFKVHQMMRSLSLRIF